MWYTITRSREHAFKEDNKLKKLYMVFCDAIHGDPTWDTFVGKFESFEAAKSAADKDWMYTSEHERSNRTTYVACAEVPDDIDQDDIIDHIFDSCDGYSVVYTAED